MPTLLEHMAIAGLVALPLSKKPHWILGLCWIAILPDLDLFLGLHRVVFHSLVILGPISATLLLTSWFRFPAYREPAFFTAFSLLSHTLLDFLQYWVALFWPLIPLTYWLNIRFNLTTIGPIVIPYLDIGPMIAPFNVLYEPIDATLLGPYDGILFLLFLFTTTITLWPTLQTHLQRNKSTTANRH